MTYENALFKIHYLHAKAMRIADSVGGWYFMKLKWEMSKDIFNLLKENMTVYCGYEEMSLVSQLKGIPIEIVEDEVDYIKLFIEVE